MQQKFCISTEALSQYASYHTIGFAHLTEKGNVEDAGSAGSGTLVTVGSLHGVLTAAHVVETLPEHGNVGIILNIENPAQYLKLVINMDRTEPPVVGTVGQRTNEIFYGLHYRHDPRTDE